MKKTGQRLKESREQQNLTLNEVSLSTKINSRVLQAMESGELEKLPAISFLRGFIRTYANFLKIDSNELLQLFSEELHEKTEAEKMAKQEEAPQEKTPPWHESLPLLKDSSITSRSIAAGGVVLLIIITIGIKNVVDKYEKEGDVSTPIENIESLKHEKKAVTKSGGDKLQTSDKKKPVAKPHPKKSVVTVKKNEIKKNEPKKKEITKNEPLATSNKKDKDVEPKPTPKSQKVTKKEQPPDKPKKTAQPQEIILEALDSVEIAFRIDGGRVKRVTLQPEQIHTIKGRVSVAIDLSDGGAVNVIYNGIDRGVPGDLGKPKKIKYP